MVGDLWGYTFDFIVGHTARGLVGGLYNLVLNVLHLAAVASRDGSPGVLWAIQGQDCRQ
jgi:hypothetical protein